MTALLTEFGLDQLAAEVYEAAEQHGFWELGATNEVIGTKLALVHSEVTEVLEAVRKSQGPDKIVEEMADVIIRVLDLYAGMRNVGLITSSIDDIMNEKIKYNETRPPKHGHLF